MRTAEREQQIGALVQQAQDMCDDTMMAVWVKGHSVNYSLIVSRSSST